MSMLVIVALLLSAEPEPLPQPPPLDRPQPRSSITLDVGGPIALAALLRTYGTFLELQTRLTNRFSAIVEVTYLHSENFRDLGGGFPGVKLRLGIFCVGGAFWFRRPFSGAFLSLRIEGWLGTATSNRTGTTVVTNAFDVNFQPGWQWDFGGFTVIASVSLAWVTGPARSDDGTVTFPLYGFSGTPHVRLGWVW
jgi:hypothetical protein